MNKVWVLTIVALAGFLSLTPGSGAPQDLASSKPSTTPSSKDEDVLYDQRQNGTENVRVQLSGLTVFVAPAELFALADVPGGGFGLLNRSNEPAPKSNHQKSKLVNLLMGLLHNNHQEQ